MVNSGWCILVKMMALCLITAIIFLAPSSLGKKSLNDLFSYHIFFFFYSVDLTVEYWSAMMNHFAYIIRMIENIFFVS